MRGVKIGFHLIMVVLIVAAFGGAFQTTPTGSFARDAGSGAFVIIGLVTIWIVGAIVLRIFGGAAKS